MCKSNLEVDKGLSPHKPDGRVETSRVTVTVFSEGRKVSR